MISRYVILVTFSTLLCFCTCVLNSNLEINTTKEAISPCTSRQFRCGDNKCIPVSFVCDNEKDCLDGSDENPKICVGGSAENRTCNADEFRCTSGKCIPQRWQCDNEKDCSDGSDEDPQSCQKKTCSLDEFTCRSKEGECVPLTWMCDDNQDCSDGSDEKSCNETCRSDEFTCKNGKCIQLRWVCDSDNDCVDNSDEENCPVNDCPPEFQCKDKFCFPKKWRCDGEYDCSDGKDEQGCPKTNPKLSFCLSNEYECADRFTCIHKNWLCDGSKDCPDGSDESLENCQNITCRVDQFQCKDRSCIPGHLHCSGHPDCPDGSDEEECGTPVQECDTKTQFDCGDGQCIPLSQVCDGKQHCPNFEDEPSDKCGVNECHNNNGGCQHKCIDTPASYYCDCHQGYKLVNHTACKDIDECDIPGSCSQICINDRGGYKCECYPGYMRDPRNVTRCKAIEGHASLLFARRREIRKISLDHHEMTSIVNETNSATALDFVFRTGMIFWSDVTDKKIYKAPIDEGNERTTVISDDITTSDGLAVDWIYNHIYWTDTGRNTIELSNFDGKMRMVLIKDDVDEPRAIALNPMEGWMFWTDWGINPKIERAGMDGSHRQTIVKYDVKWPNGLTLDLVKRRVYWVDAKLNSISSCDYNGKNRRVILYSQENLRHPFSITTFEDGVYWTDWDKGAVFRANKFTGEDVKAITATEMVQNPMVIHVYHPYRQPDGENYCQAVNGHCSHLCLPAPQINKYSPKISCACPMGLKMHDNGLTCIIDAAKNTSHGSTQAGDNSDSGMIAGIAIIILVAVIGVVGGVIYFGYKHLMHRNMTSMNFDNPVYRKTTEDQFSLEKNQFLPQAKPYLSTVGEEVRALTLDYNIPSSR
ncbi:unnamed protein product [Acanthoscelides obtectus]|uniref:EGF-like domain-containing protein n=1 Tax=Acanthoscelides obtectus TaxID=200917 RepID=A0A9P0KVM2_ACAOB|nr:unnamed protein product [Acanthoscelides obtectus]CAK1628549.1 Very low-density lipoprotein receptor [Acanthoscelides obtectus]